jgi:two-component system, LuxR family, response regulator FixJ
MEVKDYASAQSFLRDETKAENGCLILDNQMPGMSGLELLQKLRERNDALPVVIVTGNNDPVLRARAEKAGALAVLDKPIDDEKLIPLVQRSILAGKAAN